MKSSLGGYEDAIRARMAELAPAIPRIWRKDASFWGDDASMQASVSNRLGWLDVVGLMQGRLQEIQEFSAGLVQDGFRDAVVLGMGGSSLAPEVLGRSIADHRPDRGGLRLRVLDTTDPATILQVANDIDVERTLFFVSSKSGTTIEALSLFAYFHDLVKAKVGRDAGRNFAAITDEGTPLQELARDHGFRATFVNPDDIGGRYSALSYFGLVPAAVAGVDISLLLKRAAMAAPDATLPTADALGLGAALGLFALGGRDKCTFLLSPRIASFGLWLEQLIAESTGKQGRGVLPVVGEPYVGAGAYRDDRFFVFVRLDADDNTVSDPQAAGIEAAGFPVIQINLADVYDLGKEFFRWEFAVAVAGKVLGLNPFDEPNVQESKDNTARVLAEFELTGEIAKSALKPGSQETQEALNSVVAGIEPNGYFAITAYSQSTPPLIEALQQIRATVVEHLGVATTLGFGPRFLHSTGQYHKGGPQRATFLQILGGDSNEDARPVQDIPIPGRKFTFGQLKDAQAAGDRESLGKRGRTVVTIDLTGNAQLGWLCEALRAASVLREERGG